ncbi:MAG: Dabb family protein [Gammaproteobacteria bacterium]|nr:Dabb family protein [Gammaproteobacteria bacterium]
MLRQITLIKFNGAVSAEEIESIGRGFAEISAIVDGIRRFEFGPDLGLMDGTYDYALVIDFDSQGDWKAYLEHPKHVAFAETFTPLAAAAVRVQYKI